MGRGKGNSALKEEDSELRKGVHSWERQEKNEMQEWIENKEDAVIQQTGYEGSREKTDKRKDDKSERKQIKKQKPTPPADSKSNGIWPVWKSTL